MALSGLKQDKYVIFCSGDQKSNNESIEKIKVLLGLTSLQRLWGRIYSLPFQRMLSVVSFQQWHHSDFCFHHHFSFSDSHLFVTKLMDVLLVTDAPASQLFFTEAAGVVSSACLQRYFRHSQTVCLCFPHRNGNWLHILFSPINNRVWRYFHIRVKRTYSFYSCMLVHNVDSP